MPTGPGPTIGKNNIKKGDPMPKVQYANYVKQLLNVQKEMEEKIRVFVQKQLDDFVEKTELGISGMGVYIQRQDAFGSIPKYIVTEISSALDMEPHKR